MTAAVPGAFAPSPAAAGPAVGAAAAKAPPAHLPGIHFAAALAFFVAGTAGLVVLSPVVAAGQVLSPRIAALTHLFTLGWITTSIMGALYQFLPVALDEPIRSVRIAYITFAAYVPGLAVFAAGVGAVRHVPMLAGAALLATGVLLFAGNLAVTLRRAVRRDVTWWALALATVHLVFTLVLGLALAGNLRWGWLGGGRLAAIGVHLHVALAGWVLLVMIGVAHRLLPMFLLSHGAGDRFARAAVALIATGAGVLALLHHAPPLISRWIPAAFIALGLLAFLLQARAYFAHRHRPALDPGMRLAAGALALLALALAASWPVVSGIASIRFAAAYVAAAILGISLFVAAHYYRIVPFLVWYHRFGPLAGRRPVPRVHDLYSARLASIATSALIVGALVTVVSIATGAAASARIAAAVLATGAAVQTWQMIRLWRTRP